MSKDLEQKELKKSFKKNILYALNNAKNEFIRITFVLTGTDLGTKFTYREHITYFAGVFTYKNVCLNKEIANIDTIINIILDNFSYNLFSYIDCKEKIGKVECQGYGEYWGEDRFTFNYKRMNCN